MNRFKLFAAVACLAVVFTSTATADIVPFQWSSSGSFSPSASPAWLAFFGAPLSALTNTNASGNLDINLGHFTFGDITTDYSGTFTLTVDFYSPDNVTGSPLLVHSLTLLADANTNGINDRLDITFPTAGTYNFSGADGIGSFSFGVQDVHDFRTGRNKPDNVPLTGQIRGADITVPEPASILGLGTLLLVLGSRLRRKRA